MNNKIIHSTVVMVIIVFFTTCWISCSSDSSTPMIEGVWNNTASVPIEQISCAYPGQTVCLHGTGFSNLKQIVVNNTVISISNTAIYDTDSFVTFKMPDSVATTVATSLKYIKLLTDNGETTFEPFIIKPTSERPSISSVSTTSLTAGSILQIKGANLNGVQHIYLPLTFEQSVECQIDTSQVSDASNVYIDVPQGVNFASGLLKIVMQKTDSVTSSSYTENVYSKTINFKN